MSPRSFAATVLLFLTSSGSAHAGAPLETETARMPPKGTFETEASLEVQTSSDGHEFASPIAFEYSLTDRVTFLAEPVPITTIRPKVGPRASGLGDLELTLTGLVVSETRGRCGCGCPFRKETRGPARSATRVFRFLRVTGCGSAI